MRTAIEIFGIESLIGLLMSSVAGMLGMIWDNELAVRIAASAFVVSGAILVAALSAYAAIDDAD